MVREAFFLVFYLSIHFALTAQEANVTVQDSSSSRTKNLQLRGYLKMMSSTSIPEWSGNWYSDNLIHNRLNLKWHISKSCNLRIEARTRLFFGETVKLNPQFANAANTTLDYYKIGGQLLKGNSFLLNTFIDRACLDWSYKRFQIVIGKQRINWSQSFVWNPIDIYNSYSFFDFDYEERRGTDAVRTKLSLQKERSIEVVCNVQSSWSKTTTAIRYSLKKWSYDWQLIAGKVESDAFIGTGWSGQIKSIGFKGESGFFYPYIADSLERTFTVDMSFDYTLPNSLSFRIEGLFNSNPVKVNDSLILMVPLSSKNISFTTFSFFLSTRYDITPLIQVNVNGIWFPDDQSCFINPSLTFNLNSNSELLLASQLFFGQKPGIYGDLGHFVFSRLKWSF